MQLADFLLPTGLHWPEMPPLGASIVIGTTPTSDGLRAIRLKEALRVASSIGEDRLAVLHGSDRLLHRLARSSEQVGQRLREAGASGVIGPGFSTWWFWTPFDSLAAMALSARVAAQIARFVATAPTVVWRNDHDLDRWAIWIRAEGIRTIAVDLGTLRARRPWRWGMESLAVLAEALGRLDWEPHLIVNGPSTIERLRDVRASWPGGLTFASQSPWHLAQSGKKLLHDLQWVHDDASKQDLRITNQLVFEAAAEGVLTRTASVSLTA